MQDTVIAKRTKFSRRDFIVGSAAVAGGGLALGLNVPFGIGSAQAQSAATEVNIWVRPCAARRGGTGVRLE
jgi:hypothetical protein